MVGPPAAVFLGWALSCADIVEAPNPLRPSSCEVLELLCSWVRQWGWLSLALAGAKLVEWGSGVLMGAVQKDWG